MVDFLPDIDGLWFLWSIKEAAFKSAVKGGWDIRFAGKDFPVSDVAPHKSQYISEVQTIGERLSVTTHIADDWVHSFVSVSDREVHGNVLSLNDPNYQVQSKEVKAAAIEALKRCLDMSREDVTIAKDDQEVPYFFSKGKFMKVDLTLSHHGRFGAYLFAL